MLSEAGFCNGYKQHLLAPSISYHQPFNEFGLSFDTNVKALHLKMHFAKFSCNWPSCSGEIDGNEIKVGQ